MLSILKKVIIFCLIVTTLSKNLHSKKSHKDNTPEVIEKIKSFIKEENYNKSKLDEILQSGRIGGFYDALDFFEIVTNLHYEFPEYLTDFIQIGRTYQNRELKAFKLGDLGFLNRK